MKAKTRRSRTIRCMVLCLSLFLYVVGATSGILASETDSMLGDDGQLVAVLQEAAPEQTPDEGQAPEEAEPPAEQAPDEAQAPEEAEPPAEQAPDEAQAPAEQAADDSQAAVEQAEDDAEGQSPSEESDRRHPGKVQIPVVYSLPEQDGPEGIVKPEVKLTLVRKAAGAESYEQAYTRVDAENPEAREIEITTKTDISKEDATWFRTYLTDEEGNPYTFQVEMKYVEPNPLDSNWIFRSEAFVVPHDYSGVTSIRMAPELEFVTGTHVIGELNISKVLDNDAADLQGANGTGDVNGPRLSFPVEVAGPYGYKRTVDISPGDTVTLDKLYYGTYTVTELDDTGSYDISYSTAGGKVDLVRPEYPYDTPVNEPKTVLITNVPKQGTDAVATLLAKKIWEGGARRGPLGWVAHHHPLSERGCDRQ